MCGLAGIFDPNGGPVDRALLQRMTDVLSHRGPDGDGFHFEPGVGLGHRRLSVIDVAGGHQPMWNEDESVVIVFNGEIYNFSELWPKLQALGHVFRSNHSDTEAIVHAWESWGPECLQHLNGQFAFVLWDRKQKTLFMARDRLGKKPLHYARLPDGTLVFGSEMAAVLQAPGVSRRMGPAAIDDFFAYGYVPDPHTIYDGVQKLPAGALPDAAGGVPCGAAAVLGAADAHGEGGRAGGGGGAGGASGPFRLGFGWLRMWPLGGVLVGRGG